MTARFIKTSGSWIHVDEIKQADLNGVDVVIFLNDGAIVKLSGGYALKAIKVLDANSIVVTEG